MFQDLCWQATVMQRGMLVAAACPSVIPPKGIACTTTALAAVETEGYDLLMRGARRRLAAAGPGRPVTDDDDRRDLARLAEQERDFQEPLKVEAVDRDEFEPDELP